jgi:hypothetical protein
VIRSRGKSKIETCKFCHSIALVEGFLGKEAELDRGR